MTDIEEKFQGGEISKEESWQRRLLDLSLKNNALNFRYTRDCLHIYSAGVSAFCASTENCNKYTLSITPSPENAKFGDVSSKISAELIDFEIKSGRMRCYAPDGGLEETVSSLIRKARISEEETGANTLYLALGFLKWQAGVEKEDRFAPVALMPVKLRRQKNLGVILETGEEYEVNYSLIEFLKREFETDLKSADFKGLSPSQIICLFRAKTAHITGCFVYEDVYLAQFTFAKYAMWADIKNNADAFRKNPIVASLIAGESKLLNNRLEEISEDRSDPASVYTPLPCDGTQFSAVAESARGTTFVLHGPPGTGKSQTITNIIANALARGKRVLFVAQKQAALEVVKKRLCDIGLDDFCLELHSGTAGKGEIVRFIENTLALSSDFDEGAFYAVAEKIVEMRRTAGKPLHALHKKRRSGVSVYEGIVNYLSDAGAPDLVDIESSFYDGLTQKKIEECENMLTSAQAAAKECGEVHRSPFKEVNLTDCDERTKLSVLCSAKTVLAELRHLKNYLNIFLNTFNQKISRLTGKRLKNLIEICKILQSGALSAFFDCGEEELHAFYRASLKYDSGIKRWFERFKSFPDISKFMPEMKSELEKWDENYRSSRTLLGVLKKIHRCAGGKISQSEELEWIKRAYAIEEAKEELLSVRKLSSAFTGICGINEKRRAEFMRPLYEFDLMCADTFKDYNADSFHSVCANGGWALDPLVGGLELSATRFSDCIEGHLEVIKAKNYAGEGEDLFDCYTKKCNALIENIDMLPAWCKYKATAKRLKDCGLTFMADAMESGKVSGTQVLSSFRKNIYRNLVQIGIASDDCLSSFSSGVLEENISAFSALLEEYYTLSRKKIRASLISRLASIQTDGGLALDSMKFQRRIKGNLRGFKLRELFYEIPNLLKVVAPCVLTSPETVSKLLPADTELFDTVVFDEASQIPTCEAVPALARAKSAIIVGDPKQMPPTSFFSCVGQDEEYDDCGDLESVLEDFIALGIPEKHLIWHYRSGHESLIAFSNAEYYSNKLCTFPSPDELNSKVKLKYIENGVYERGLSKCNRAEAEALVKEVISRLKDEKLKKYSIGIVTFSTPQQLLIERMLLKAITADKLEEIAYGGSEPVFVKNLENVQGDERDIILFSVCYGPDKAGKLSLNFGPLNAFGGWRRLNVAVSRAREEMVVFSSMRYPMIDLARTNSRGVAGLKAFLEFAENGKLTPPCRGDGISASVQGIGRFVAEQLKACGYDCRCNLGVSDFKIDIAVADPADKKRFILAILTDGTDKFSVKDREIMQREALKRGEWNIYKLHTINFFNNPKREIKKIKQVLDRLTRASSSQRLKASDYSPIDIISLARGILKSKAYINLDEIVPALLKKMKVPKTGKKLAKHICSCIEEGVRQGIFIRSVADRISLA